jgi:ABC-2 type transport system permease protein
MSYLRLWRRFIIAAFVRESAYRFNFAVSVGQGIIQVLLAMLTFVLLYQFTNMIAGWTSAEVLVLVGVYRMIDGWINVQIAPNMFALSETIRNGDLDLILLRPVQSQFLVSSRIIVLPELVNVVIGLALAVFAGLAAGVRWDALGIAEAVAFMVCGLVLIYAAWFGVATVALLVYENQLNVLFYSLFETARYPVTFFSAPVRTLLTFVVPVAFATTFPVEALLGRGNHPMLIIGIGLAVALLLGTHLFWNYALRRYGSASS